MPTSADGPGVTRRETLGAFGGAAAMAAASAAPAAQMASASAPVPISLLYPHESATRSTRALGGLWSFRLDAEDKGEREKWFDGFESDRRIPVPCSWNDLFDDAKNHFGPSWYETELWVGRPAAGRRIELRFGSAIYHARVWLNGQLLGEHAGGYIPFGFDITDLVRPGESNRLVVRVENLLLLDRVPPIPDPAIGGMSQQDYPQTSYDFFPYSGLNRPVLLCETPDIRVRDITVSTDLSGAAPHVSIAIETTRRWSGNARISIAGGPSPISATVAVANGTGTVTLPVPRARLWSPDDPHLYRLTVTLGRGLDQYHMPIGLRTIVVEGSKLLLNGKPIFLRGFGKHEDSAISGRSLDLPMLVRDFQLLKWIGANSFRTSHYPCSEEALMLADEAGLLVIAETPGVGLIFVDKPDIIEARYRALDRALVDLIRRDKNHPSVIMWSLANEPLAKPYRVARDVVPETIAAGESFFKRLFARARAHDPTRPCTIVTAGNGPVEWARLGDVICTNSYNGWYNNPGQLEAGRARLGRDLKALREMHGDKPIIVTEFGADAIPGRHADPAEMWSEEYQSEMIEGYLAVLKNYPYVVGTHPWCFADFRTSQSVGRVDGMNFKGVFTRDRQPKGAAHLLRRLWRQPA